MIYQPDHHLANGHGYVRQHVVMAEKKMGRELIAGEIVHHEDGNRANNEPDNLRVFPNTHAHIRYHAEKRHKRLSAELRSLSANDWQWLWMHNDADYVLKMQRIRDIGVSNTAARKACTIVYLCFRRFVLDRQPNGFYSDGQYWEDAQRTWPLFLAFVQGLLIGTHSWTSQFVRDAVKGLKGIELEAV